MKYNAFAPIYSHYPIHMCVNHSMIYCYSFYIMYMFTSIWVYVFKRGQMCMCMCCVYVCEWICMRVYILLVYYCSTHIWTCACMFLQACTVYIVHMHLHVCNMLPKPWISQWRFSELETIIIKVFVNKSYYLIYLIRVTNDSLIARPRSLRIVPYTILLPTVSKQFIVTHWAVFLKYLSSFAFFSFFIVFIIITNTCFLFYQFNHVPYRILWQWCWWNILWCKLYQSTAFWNCCPVYN